MARMLAYGPMKRLLPMLLAIAALPAIGAAEAPRSFDKSLEPGATHEECLRLEAGEKRRYHWKASRAVDFNIHYHRGEEVVYPIRRKAMRGDGGSFTARTGEEFCWMWTARKAPARIEGQILK